jgi:hypothetical protein
LKIGYSVKGGSVMAAKTLSRFLTQKELAQLFGVTPLTARTWVKAGKLPGPIEGFGLKPRWSREAVVRWCQERGVPLSD